MSDNAIYEIAQMMGNRDAFQSDMQEAANMLNDLFRKKYINKINAAVKNSKLQIENNPPREAQLLNVLKAFVPEEKHSSYDKMIDMILMVNTFKNMNNQLSSVSIQGLDDSSIHDDGVYDVDNSCIAPQNTNHYKMANILAMMSLLSITKS